MYGGGPCHSPVPTIQFEFQQITASPGAFSVYLVYPTETILNFAIVITISFQSIVLFLDANFENFFKVQLLFRSMPQVIISVQSKNLSSYGGLHTGGCTMAHFIHVKRFFLTPSINLRQNFFCIILNLFPQTTATAISLPQTNLFKPATVNATTYQRDQKKLPNVYKSCPKMISREK